MWGSEGTGLPTWRTSTPCVVAGAGEQQRGDELRRGADASIVTVPPGHGARAVHGERQGAAAAVVDAHAERAEGGEHRADRAQAHVRVAVEAHRAAGEAGDRRHEPHHGAGEAAVDLGVAVPAAGRDGPVAVPRPRRRCRARAAPRPSAGCRASAADGVRRWGRRRARRARSARLVSDLLPGSETTAVDGVRRRGAGQGSVGPGARSPAQPIEVR